jgi:hypothetical protein
VQDLDKVKEELFQRHAQEIQAKNAELIQSERVYTERVAKLEK